MKKPKEEWIGVKGFEGLYQVSNMGSVKSNRCTLKQCDNTHGYLSVTLCKEGIQKVKTVHIIVAESFLHHKTNGQKIVIDHINHIKTDNRLSNLQVITHRENLCKDKKSGTSKYTGVSWYKITKKWKAEIGINGKCKRLGYFKNELDAHNAYQKELKKLEEWKDLRDQITQLE